MKITAIYILIICLFSKVYAYETDQYSSMFYKLKDSTEILDKIINLQIKRVVDSWEGERDDYKLVKLIAHSFDHRQMEKWANESDLIDNWKDRSDSIYKTTSAFDSPIIRYKGIASTISINNVHTGTDKLSHFFGVGHLYYIEAFVNNDWLSEKMKDKWASKIGIITEQLWWGELTTNVYSNSDLVVNFEGYLFYKSLSSDNVISGKKSIIKWVGNVPQIQRKFTFKDHVNDFWSEALLPNSFEGGFGQRVHDVLKTYCERDFYKKNKNLFVSKDQKKLDEKYKNLSLRASSNRFRMDNVCKEYDLMTREEKEVFLAEHKELEKEFELQFKEEPLTPTKLIFKDIPKKYRSMLPHCNKEIKRASREHFFVKQHYEQYTKNILNGLKDEIQNWSVFNNESSYNSLDLYRMTGNLNYMEKDYSLIFRENIQENSERICVKTKVDFKDQNILGLLGEKKVKSKRIVFIENCLVKTSDKITESINYEIEFDKGTIYSQDIFNDFFDEENYVYRTISYECRWY